MAIKTESRNGTRIPAAAFIPATMTTKHAAPIIKRISRDGVDSISIIAKAPAMIKTSHMKYFFRFPCIY
jgi:hypothetical protein